MRYEFKPSPEAVRVVAIAVVGYLVTALATPLDWTDWRTTLGGLATGLILAVASKLLDLWTKPERKVRRRRRRKPPTDPPANPPAQPPEAPVGPTEAALLRDNVVGPAATP